MKVGKRWLAAIGVAALAVPAAAIAHPGHGHGNDHGKNHKVQYIFRGAYAGSGLVSVTGGNHHARKADLVGTDVQLDLTGTKLDVADTNADQVVDVNDLVTDDQVLVQVRLPKQDPGAQPFAARHLVDQTNPADSDSSEDTSDAGDES